MHAHAHVGAGDNRIQFAAVAALRLRPSCCRWPGDCLLRAVPFAACSRRVAAPARALAGPLGWCRCARHPAAPALVLRPGPGTGRVHGAWPERYIGIRFGRPMPGLAGFHNRRFCVVPSAAVQGQRPQACRSKLNILFHHDIVLRLFPVNAVPDTGPHGTILACTTLHQGKAAPHLHAPHLSAPHLPVNPPCTKLALHTMP